MPQLPGTEPALPAALLLTSRDCYFYHVTSNMSQAGCCPAKLWGDVSPAEHHGDNGTEVLEADHGGVDTRQCR